MNHKSFVFFDCECANTFDGVGKICSLGYVIADDDLNVLESEDVVINPECEFDWYLFSGKGECKLAYSKDYFRIKPNWDSYYKEIKKMFTTGNRYVLGFAVGNDVAFVNSACERYNENYINFRAFDLEKLLEQLYDEKHKLVEWAQKFGVNVAKYQSHKSVDDAMMTMLCLKKVCEEQQTSVENLLNQHKDLFVSAENMLILQEERAYRREITEKIKRLYNKKCPKPRHKTIVGNYYEFDNRLLKDVDTAFELIKKIYDNGGTVVEHLVGSGQVIYLDENAPSEQQLQKLKKRGVNSILLSEINEIIK